MLLGMILLLVTTTRAGVCPDGALSIMDCVTNDCPGGYQCVQGSCCQFLANVTVDLTTRDDPSTAPSALKSLHSTNDDFTKSGACPKIDHFPRIAGLVECQNDFDCHGVWKCCSTPSGSFCFDIQHAGVDVSTQRFNNKQRSAEPTVCVEDGDCEKPSKCVVTRRGKLCLAPSASSRNCAPNEEFVLCASNCQTGCARKDDYSVCTDKICRRGCICKPGFVRMYHNDQLSKCIPLARCIDIQKSEELKHPSDGPIPVRCDMSLDCPKDHICKNHFCILTKASDNCGSAISAGAGDPKCPDGQSAKSACSRGQCPAGFKCFNGACCPFEEVNKFSMAKSRPCPKVELGNLRGRVHFCDADGDCFPNEMCCMTSTGRQCLQKEVESSSDGDKASWQRCSDGSRSVQTCYSDMECDGRMQCENGLCCPIRSPVEKGECPRMFFDYEGITRSDHCHSDDDCVEMNRKCCPTLLGRRCLLPVDSSKRLARHEHVCADGSRPVGNCDGDHCSPGYLCEVGHCCRYESVALSSNDHCPPLNFMQQLSSFPSCVINVDCPGSSICCPAPVGGKKCVQPTRRKHETAVSLSSCGDHLKPLGRIPLRCKDNSNCPNSALCCPINGVNVCTGLS